MTIKCYIAKTNTVKRVHILKTNTFKRVHILKTNTVKRVHILKFQLKLLRNNHNWRKRFIFINRNHHDHYCIIAEINKLKSEPLFVIRLICQNNYSCIVYFHPSNLRLLHISEGRQVSFYFFFFYDF